MSAAYVPKHSSIVREYLVFILKDEEPMLAAQYFSDEALPKAGEVLQINLYKVGPGFPDQVKVLRIEALDYIKTSPDDPARFSIIAEPFFSTAIRQS
jgi:hypothetical protein